VILLVGILLVVSDRVLFIGRGPGGIGVPNDVWTTYAPLATAIALSVGTAVLSLMAWMRLKENP
jgi:DUF2905 family protein